MRTKEQLEHAARIVADIVKNTNTDQRHELYSMIGEMLRNDAQGYSARLFEWIAAKDRNG